MAKNKAISKIVYIFDDHYKSSNDYFRSILGKFYDFDGEQIKESSIKSFPLSENAEFNFEKPFLLDEDKSIFIQKVKFKPADTIANKTFLGLNQNQTFGNAQTVVNNSFGLDLFSDTSQSSNTQTNEDLGLDGNVGASDDPYGERALIPRRLRQDIGGGETPGPVPPINPINNSQQQVTQTETKKYKIIDQIKDFLAGNPYKEFKDINFQTIRLVEYDSELTSQYFKLDSYYNFYVESYENILNNVNGVIPEQVLPNFYVYSLIKDSSLLKDVSQSDYDSTSLNSANSAYDNFYQRFDKFITLDGNLSLNGNKIDTYEKAVAVLLYYKAYAESFDTVSVDFVDTFKDRFNVFVKDIYNTNLFERLISYAKLFPMYIDLQYYSPLHSPFFDWMQTTKISLSSLQNFITKDLLIKSKSVTDNEFVIKQTFFELSKDIYKDKIIYNEQTKDLTYIEFDEWFNKFLNLEYQDTETPTITFINPNVGPILGSIDGPEINQYDFINNITSHFKYNELIRNNIRSYEELLNGELAKTEIICFKIEKRDDADKLIQTFFVLNVPNLEIERFIDTQVKYNKNYTYTIYAWHIIYGTRYSYQKSVDVFDVVVDLEPVPIPPQEEFVHDNNIRNNLDFGIRQEATTQSSNIRNNLDFGIKSDQPDSTNIRNKLDFGIKQDETDDLWDTHKPSGIPEKESNKSKKIIKQFKTVSKIEQNKLKISKSKVARLRQIDQFNDLPENIPSRSEYQEETPKPTSTNIRQVLDFKQDKINIHRYLDFGKDSKDENSTSFEFEVVYKPEIKIIETLYSDSLKTKVLDKPPTAPTVTFYEHINNPLISIAIQPSAGEYREKPILILNSDVDYFVNQIVIQNSTDMKILFKNDGDIKQVQVFKLDKEPIKYSDFKLYKIFKYPEQSAFDEINHDEITYYYIFRLIDVHGNISNPSEIYTTKTINNNGFYYQEFGSYEIKSGPDKSKDKSFKKYLKISPSLLQKTYNYDTNGLGILPQTVFNKQFLMKIRSKHTGKLAKILLKFNLTEKK